MESKVTGEQIYEEETGVWSFKARSRLVRIYLDIPQLVGYAYVLFRELRAKDSDLIVYSRRDVYNGPDMDGLAIAWAKEMQGEMVAQCDGYNAAKELLSGCWMHEADS